MPVLDKENYISKDISKFLISNLSSLVGRNIDIISEQFQGQPLTCRVVLVNGKMLTIDKNSEHEQLKKLINNQDIILQFEYQNQRISVNAVFYRTMRNRCNIEMGNKFVPLARRRFLRYKLSHQIKCASMPNLSFNPAKISRLRWLETESINISSGGVLIPLPTKLNKESYLLMNLKAQKHGFPNLLVGQVRHCVPAVGFNHNIGIEFITREHKEKHFPLLTIKRLPPNAFEFNDAMRNKIEKDFMLNMQNK